MSPLFSNGGCHITQMNPMIHLAEPGELAVPPSMACTAELTYRL